MSDTSSCRRSLENVVIVIARGSENSRKTEKNMSQRGKEEIEEGVR